ncbi:MAG: thioredoxin-dependent peroxiredoxin [Gammaproteobacteria bacterium]|jgi:peroxiredoxin Q/BCP|nr:thioredoxin-dependent peroxiredoxin [Gammaproteobacteria bacterium]
MAAVKIGSKVKDFSLPASGDNTWSLKEVAGEKLVIYFYPKDMTGGCTKESQDFRDLYEAFRKAGVNVIGVSRDSVKSHDKFIDKEKLPFPLLSDVDEKLCKQFDVIQEKSLYGRKYLGIERSTFLLDGTGILRREWRKVKVPGHAEEVLEAAKSL